MANERGMGAGVGHQAILYPLVSDLERSEMEGWKNTLKFLSCLWKWVEMHVLTE